MEKGVEEQQMALLDDRQDLKADLRSDEETAAPKLPTLDQEMTAQSFLGLPVALAQIANLSLSLVALAFVAQLGSAQLAAAALATILYNMTAKVFLTGMLGALETYSSQAVGARAFGALGSMFWQACSFLLLHTIPIGAALVSIPALLRQLGQPEDIVGLLQPYLLALLPTLGIEAVFRPLNQVLVAQQISAPQMWVSMFAAVLHFPVTHLCVHTLNEGYLGAAYATVWSNLLCTLLVAIYVRWSGLSKHVWAVPNGITFQPWGPYLKLSYAAVGVRAINSWSLGLCTIAAGFLPNPATALTAMSVASLVYSVVRTVYDGLVAASCTRVGNFLGAGNGPRAKLSGLASLLLVQAIWALLALLLLFPIPLESLISLVAGDVDLVLPVQLRHLLDMLALLALFDGGQLVLSGVALGAAKQTTGLAITAGAGWGLGVPATLLLGFHLNLGVEGLCAGLILGAMAQLADYAFVLFRLDWEGEALAVQERLLLLTDSPGDASSRGLLLV